MRSYRAAKVGCNIQGNLSQGGGRIDDHQRPRMGRTIFLDNGLQTTNCRHLIEHAGAQAIEVEDHPPGLGFHQAPDLDLGLLLKVHGVVTATTTLESRGRETPVNIIGDKRVKGGGIHGKGGSRPDAIPGAGQN